MDPCVRCLTQAPVGCLTLRRREAEVLLLPSQPNTTVSPGVTPQPVFFRAAQQTDRRGKLGRMFHPRRPRFACWFGKPLEMEPAARGRRECPRGSDPARTSGAAVNRVPPAPVLAIVRQGSTADQEILALERQSLSMGDGGGCQMKIARRWLSVPDAEAANAGSRLHPMEQQQPKSSRMAGPGLHR